MSASIVQSFESEDITEDYFEDDDYESPDGENAVNEFEENPDIVTGDVPVCEAINIKPEEGEKPFSKVVGLERQKEELLLVAKWFKSSKELKTKGVSVPKGVIMYGNPGNGKSLLIKELIKFLDAPVFVFQGDQPNVVGGILETFKQARKTGHAVIVFDELDLLINKEQRVVRVLQECLDGVESTDDILVLTATNSLGDIPKALLRDGRLEKHLEVPSPDGETALALLKKHLTEFGLPFPEDADEEEIALLLCGVNCAGIKSLVNDAVLRNGFEGLTSEMLENSIYNILDCKVSDPERDNLQVAIHEAAHAVVAMQFPEHFIVNRLEIDGARGEFHAKDVENDSWPYEKAIADIKVSMAGMVGEKLIFGMGSVGCGDDLQNARRRAYNLYNISGYSSAWETLPAVETYARLETQLKRRRMERKIEKFLRKSEKETYRIVEEFRPEIEKLGQALFEKKRMKASEILACVNGSLAARGKAIRFENRKPKKAFGDEDDPFVFMPRRRRVVYGRK